MFALTLSPSQLVSSAFLIQLVEQGLARFSLNGNVLKADSALLETAQDKSNDSDFPLEPYEQHLLVFTEGLNLQSLHKVADSLSSCIKVQYWQAVRVEGVQGFAVVGKVNMLSSAEEVKPQLETAANRFSLELCLFARVPTLSESGLLLMDMDSTVIACECIDDIATLAGVGQEVSAVTALAMQGKLDFAQSLRTRVACLANADEAILQTVRDGLPLMPGAANLVRLLKQHRWRVAIASGGFTYFADYLAERLELDAAVANKLEIVDGKLTGKVAGDIVDAQVKAQTLLGLAKKWSIPHSQTIAMGDGANDLLMMSAAALGVALHAKPIVREQADVSIRRGGLDALLWILAAQE